MAVPQVGIDGAGNLCAAHVYDWHEAIKDIPGARFMGRKQVRQPHWRLPPTPGAATLLLSILADTGAKVSPRVRALAQEGAGREAVRDRAANESIPLPRLPWQDWLKTSPWPHQQRGIAYLKDSSVAAIGAGMGTGKTLMTVGAMNALGLTRVVLVAPAAAFGVFPRQFRLHSAREWHVVNCQERTKTGKVKRPPLERRWAEQSAALTLCSCGKPHAVILGYEAMTRDPVASADLGALGVELVVYDECHRLKAAGGAASWTAKSWVTQVPRRWGLSGTLMPQGPWDIYGTYRALDPSIFGTSQTLFRSEFIVMGKSREGREHPKDVRPDKRVEFSRRFHSIAYIPKVDLKLPPATHVIRGFELEPEARRIYNQIRDTGVAEITAAVAAAGGSTSPGYGERTVAPANAGVEMLRFAQITGGSVTDDDGSVTVVSKAKVTELGEVLDEVGCRTDRGEDAEPEPVVVFCRFTPDLDAIRELAEGRGLRYREVSGARKDGLDDDSRMHPDCDALGVQIQAGSESVDFTRARFFVWYSIGFELWRFQQAQKRGHRPGQTRQITNIYLIAEATIDPAIYAALARRENVIDSCVNAYLQHVAEQSTESLPEMPVDDEDMVAAESAALPGWLTDERPRREVADPERDAEHAALMAAGLEGF